MSLFSDAMYSHASYYLPSCGESPKNQVIRLSSSVRHLHIIVHQNMISSSLATMNAGVIERVPVNHAPQPNSIYFPYGGHTARQ
ncbi:hypothetical protein M378DRAFT_166334 [Amanita muscaria Koide BX008]|uniref:Uncharacterized protein n=1 Tax=Amanita muscaria (strain Koide BX008) TaxID=946122 RepID=A0A0C2WYD6_AMAMK|nr:hypothetical protein M378DRAFT_166334 [Amanita muscaria Koide BX008]